MRTGAPTGEIRVERSTWLNDIAVSGDGTIYATQTGDRGENPDPMSWQVLKISAAGQVSVFVQGAPLRQPNGIAFDPQGQHRRRQRWRPLGADIFARRSVA